MRRRLQIVLLVSATCVVALVPAASAVGPDRSLATVGETTLPVSQYHHWQRIARHDDPRASGKALRMTVMAFLLSADWTTGEADEQGITVTAKQVTAEFEKTKKQAFKTEKAFRRFLRESGQTVADVKFRVRIDMLGARIKPPADFLPKWKARTLCKPAYTVADYCGGVLPPAPPDSTRRR